MSDDLWRNGRPGDDAGDEEWDDLGEPVFSEDVPLKFGPDDTGPLPHWTEPPTGEIPVIFADRDPSEDLDVWSSFAQQAPVWKDDVDDTTHAPASGPTSDVPPAREPEPRYEPLFEDPVRDASAGIGAPEPIVADAPPKAREPIRIGSDLTGERPRPRTRSASGRGGARREADDVLPSSRGSLAGASGSTRDMPTAIALGLGLAAVFVVLIRVLGSTGVMALVVAILGLAAVEFYDKTQERGYRPATVTGVVACVLIPLAAYWQGEAGIVVGLFLAAAATMITMMGFSNVESGPLPNAAITLLGIVWIGTLGAFAGLLLRGPAPFGEPYGTDTIFALVIAVVANDVGALIVGTAGGRTPLREWISPNKTVEGLIGGAVVTIGAMMLLKIANSNAQTWLSWPDVIAFGVMVAVLAPIGDLTESMFKRNLEIKDFGTLLPGHGGILDRFDGFLFTLPAAYYLLVALEPYTHI